MSAVEVYNPKFDDFHGKPMVTWQGGKRPVTVDLNLYAPEPPESPTEEEPSR